MSKQGDSWKAVEWKEIPASLDLFQMIFKYVRKDHKILDIGCGFGKTCFELWKKGYKDLFGVDISVNGIEYAQKLMYESGMKNPEKRFINGDAQKILFKKSQFDFIITQAFWTSIMPNERKTIMKEINRLLKNGGYYYLAQFGQTWDNPEYKERYEDGVEKGYERGTFESIDQKSGKIKYFAHHYTKEELEELIKSADLKIIDYSKEKFTTQSGNVVDGHVIIAQK